MTKQGISISIFVLVLLAIGGFFAFMRAPTDVSKPLVTSFEECAQAGYPVMESYPRQCRSANGVLFVEKVSVTPPTDDNTRIAAGYISGNVTIGPSCGGPEIQGQPCVTPPEAYTSREVVVYGADGTEETRMRLDAKGNYKIAVAPGKHLVQIVPAGIGPGEKKLATVKSWETTTVNFDIDTGIR